MNSVFKSLTCSYKEPYPPLRIADVLLIDEEEEQEEDDGGDLPLMENCINRRAGGCVRTVSRWLSGLRKGKKRIPVQSDEKVEDVAENNRDSINVLNDGDPLSFGPRKDESERSTRDTSFNIGVGYCLLYLIAASKNELDKMTELRKQMEALLDNANQEPLMKDTLHEPSETNDIFAYSTTGGPERSVFDRHHSPENHTPSHPLPEPSTFMVSDESLKCYVPIAKPEERPEGMDQLEVELEAEFQRLQLHLDNEKLQHPHQLRVKVTAKDTVSTSRHSWSSGEVINPVIEPQWASNEEYSGVSPYALERKLHEVLEARQQEQIRELEAALECARRKLLEKEIEISWWRDTAKLFSQHIPLSSRHSSDHDHETRLFLR